VLRISLKICQDGSNRIHNGNQFRSQDFVSRYLIEADFQGTEPVMKSSHAEEIEVLDHKSSQSICDAVGERLQQMLRPDSTGISSQLQHLLDELRKRDEAAGVKSH
jgi:hypothetical protein